MFCDFESLASHAIIYIDTNAYLPSLAMFVSLKILECMPFLAVSVAVKQLKAGFASTLLKFIVFTI